MDTHWARCAHCGEDHWVVAVFTEHDGRGRPTGPFELLCVTCLRRDGELPPLKPGSL